MAGGPIRRKTEKAIRDRAGVPVLLFYDEDNDKTIMARASEDGELKIIGEVDATIILKDADGNDLELTGEVQNNQNKLFVNSDSIEGKLDQLLTQLKIMNYHLSDMTDMQIDKHDIGEN
jgi:hypothetical protein